MKNLNRWIYAIIGVIVLLMAGLVYAWSVMSKSIAASRPDWSAAQLSMTFTMVMAFFCIGCLLAGILAKKVSPKIYVMLSGVLFFGRLFDRICHGHVAGPAVYWIWRTLRTWRRICLQCGHEHHVLLVSR